MKRFVKRQCIAMSVSVMLVGVCAVSASATVERAPGEGLSCPTPLLGKQLSEPPLYTSIGSQALAYGACKVSDAIQGITRFSADGLTMTVNAKHRSGRGEAAGFWSSVGPIAPGVTEVCLSEEVLSVRSRGSSRPSQLHHEAGVHQYMFIGGGGGGTTIDSPGPLTFCESGSRPQSGPFEWVSWITARGIKEDGVNASATVRLEGVTLR
jgi:hypothetical protein